MKVPIIDVMTTNIVSVKPSDTVLTAVKRMITNNIGNVLVIVKDKLKGILTEKDVITKVVAKGLQANEVLVKKVMTKKVITAKPSMNIQEAARLMIKQGIRRIPIKNDGQIIGVLTSNDLLRVEPALIDVLAERLKYDNPSFIDGSRGGVCEQCNSYAKRLIRINGLMVCSKCKKKT